MEPPSPYNHARSLPLDALVASARQSLSRQNNDIERAETSDGGSVVAGAVASGIALVSRQSDAQRDGAPIARKAYSIASMNIIPLLLSCNTTTIDEPVAIDDTPADSAAPDTGDAPADVTLSWRTHETIGSLIYVSWEQEDEATGYVEYSFDAEVWLQSPERSFSAGTNEQLLLGIPYETAVEIRLVVDGVTSASIEAETDDLPEGMPVPEYVSGNPDRWYPEGRYLYTSINGAEGGWTGGDFWKVILDRQGRVVWALVTPDEHWTIWTRVSYDGDDLMWDDSTVWVWGSNEESSVHRMKIDGTILDTYETPGLHHAWDELADGSIVWGAHIDSDEEWLDKRNPDGSQETIWKCSEFELEQLGETGRSCHSNSWWWHEATDTYLVSFPSTAGDVKDTVLHLDSTGATLSTWGQLSDWSFADPDTTFDYQHGVTFTDDGNLLLSTKLPQGSPYYHPNLDTLAVREYELNYEDRVLTQVWSFGEDQGIAGNTAGEAHRLRNGNTLHNYGSGARTREITADGELVWDIKWSNGDSEGSGRLQGRATFLENLYDFAP